MFLVHYCHMFSIQLNLSSALDPSPWGAGDQQLRHARGSVVIYLNLIWVVLVLHTDDTQIYGNEHSDVPHLNICSVHEHTVTHFSLAHTLKADCGVAPPSNRIWIRIKN